jgi:dTDP-4-dehydrorhamnose reductase
MRALVMGASGQVGAALGECLTAGGHEWVGTYAHVPRPGLQHLDMTDFRGTEHLIAQTAPDWVFCVGALTFVDYCEEHPDEAFRVNRDAAAVAARAAAKQGAGVVYYSTDYVFNGENGPYAEDDPVQPISIYGQSKHQGEQAVRDENAQALIIRTAVVYGPEPQGKNTVYQTLRRTRAGERLRIPGDQLCSPTYNVDLAAASVALATRALQGVFHIAGPAVLDRHAFARLICRVFGFDETLVDAVPTSALGQRAARPLRAGLRIDRAQAVLTTSLRGPEDGLRAMRAALEATSD